MTTHEWRMTNKIRMLGWRNPLGWGASVIRIVIRDSAFVITLPGIGDSGLESIRETQSHRQFRFYFV